MKETPINMKITQLFEKEPLDFSISQAIHKLDITLKDLEDVGITVSVKVPYPAWCTKEQAQQLNKQAYESIKNHSHLYTFLTLYGYFPDGLESLKDCPYSNNYIWVVIKDRMSMECNRLIITHGHAPSRKEAYYIAKDYDEFWSVVSALTDMYDNPHKEHTPIILQKNNNMCGSSYRQWEISVT